MVFPYKSHPSTLSLTTHSDDTASIVSPLLPKNPPSPNPLLMNWACGVGKPPADYLELACCIRIDLVEFLPYELTFVPVIRGGSAN